MIDLLARIHQDVVRTGLDLPGYFHVPLPRDLASRDLRLRMITIGDSLIAAVRRRLGFSMDYFSCGRVDQKRTTKPHLDGAPPRSILILGYEPSAIVSTVEVFDHPRYCRDQGISVAEFLAKRNPLHAPDRPYPGYTAAIAAFDPHAANIVVVNNSSGDPGATRMSGLMHRAVVHAGDGARVINTLTIADLAGHENHPLDEAAKQRFVESEGVDVSYGG